MKIASILAGVAVAALTASAASAGTINQGQANLPIVGDVNVPVFGMGASALILGEPLPAWKLLAAALVMAGLAINTLWPRLLHRMRTRAAAR